MHERRAHRALAQKGHTRRKRGSDYCARSGQQEQPIQASARLAALKAARLSERRVGGVVTKGEGGIHHVYLSSVGGVAPGRALSGDREHHPAAPQAAWVFYVAFGQR